MFNLDKQVIELQCPKCTFYNSVNLKQIRLRDAIICRGCKTTINFNDHMNETKKAVRQVNRALQELQDSIKRIGKITIKL